MNDHDRSYLKNLSKRCSKRCKRRGGTFEVCFHCVRQGIVVGQHEVIHHVGYLTIQHKRRTDESTISWEIQKHSTKWKQQVPICAWLDSNGVDSLCWLGSCASLKVTSIMVSHFKFLHSKHWHHDWFISLLPRTIGGHSCKDHLLFLLLTNGQWAQIHIA